ncbi:hypothetical protein D3C75_1144100 [compost metagenome]
MSAVIRLMPTPVAAPDTELSIASRVESVVSGVPSKRTAAEDTVAGQSFSTMLNLVAAVTSPAAVNSDLLYLPSSTVWFWEPTSTVHAASRISPLKFTVPAAANALDIDSAAVATIAAAIIFFFMI